MARVEDENVGSDAAYDNIANENDDDMEPFNGNSEAAELNNSLNFED